jgi:hypothetical protein
MKQLLSFYTNQLKQLFLHFYRNLEVTNEQENIVMFMVVLMNFVGYTMLFSKIINFNPNNFLITTGTNAALFLIIFSKNIKSFVKSLDYVSLFKRVMFVLLLGLFCTEMIYCPYVLKSIKYADHQKVEKYMLPITAVSLGRVGGSGIYYQFKGERKYLGFNSKKVSEINRNGIRQYCFSLHVKRGLDSMYFIQEYDIVSCNR